VRHLLIVLAALVVGLDPSVARAQAAPQPATAAAPARGPVVVRKSDVIYGRVEGSAAGTPRRGAWPCRLEARQPRPVG